MKKIWSILLIFCAVPVYVWAAPSTVISGEHNTYSRLVTPIRGSDWSVTQQGRSVVLSFENYDEGFDTSRIFDFIPRDRIKDVRTSKDTITVSLGCDCAVSAVTERDLYVVLDVANDATTLLGSPLPNEDIETPQPKPSRSATRTPSLDFMSIGLRPPSKPQVDLPDEVPLAANRLQERLSIELGSALRRGILEPSTSTKKLSLPAPPKKDPTPPAAAPEKKTKPEVETALNSANLRIRTNRDLPGTFRDLDEIVSEKGKVCPPDTTMAVATWGDNRPFAEQISDARQGLYGEFDRIDPKVALKLAKTYLYFGFGAEARNVLFQDPKVAKNAGFLLAMAEIVDGADPGQSNPFRGLDECHGETALWAVLSAPVPAQGALAQSDSSLRALNSLPPHLRVILAPRLKTVLLAYGDPNGAATTMRSLDRLSGTLPPEAQLAQAESNITKGNTEKAQEQLEKVVAENAAQSPVALITLVDTKLKAGQPIDPKTAQLVEAYVHELGKTELGPELLEAHIIALVQSNQFDTAFENAKQIEQKNDPAKKLEIHQFMVASLTQSASDIVFLDHAFQQTAPELSTLPKDDVMAFAARLLKLGFPIDAERALAVLPSPATDEDQKMLTAKVSLAMGKPFKAQASILGVQGIEADQLRAEANQMSGAHDAAHQLYAQLDQTQDAREAAFLSEDWRSLTAQDTPVFGATSALPETPLLPGVNTGMLARTSSLLDQSAEARSTLQELLDAAPLQVETDTE